MFSVEERHLFNLLTLDFEYPFPFDIETLSHFYKSSRILVYTSDDERRPRTVAYAIASGMPTVLMASVASLLPVEKQLKPLVYIAQKYAPERIQDLKLLYEDEMQRALEEDSQRTSVYISPFTYFGDRY